MSEKRLNIKRRPASFKDRPAYGNRTHEDFFNGAAGRMARGLITILRDTREQRPYFKNIDLPALLPGGVDDGSIIDCTLETGDLTLALPCASPYRNIVIDRKSPTDMLGCIGKSRDRFENELGRLSSYDYAVVLVECSLDSLIDPEYQISVSGHVCKIPPRAIVASCLAWSMRYNVHFHYGTCREFAERLAFRMLSLYWTDLRHEMKYPRT